MRERQFTKCSSVTISFIAVWFMPHQAYAQSSALEQAGIELGNPEYEETVRRKYVNDLSMPDHLAFPILLDTVSELDRKNPIDALNMVRAQLKIGQSDAERLLQLILDERTEARDEIAKSIQELFCESGVQRVSGSQVFQAMDASVDEEERIGKKRLTDFESRLSEAERQRLSKWLDEIKATTVHIIYDHEKHFARIGQDPDAIVGMFCGQ